MSYRYAPVSYTHLDVYKRQVLFDNFTNEKRARASHLEVDKLIPVDNASHLLHTTGQPPAAPPPTYPPFHEDKFLHEPPSEVFADNRQKPMITEFNDSPLGVPSAVEERQQYRIVKYESNIKPILQQSVSEKSIVNVQVPIESKFSNGNENLVNITSNPSSVTYSVEKYSTTTVPGYDESEPSPTPVTTVSVFSNFRDKLLNIIMPKAVDDLSLIHI